MSHRQVWLLEALLDWDLSKAQIIHTCVCMIGGVYDDVDVKDGFLSSGLSGSLLCLFLYPLFSLFKPSFLWKEPVLKAADLHTVWRTVDSLTHPRIHSRTAHSPSGNFRGGRQWNNLSRKLNLSLLLYLHGSVLVYLVYHTKMFLTP